MNALSSIGARGDAANALAPVPQNFDAERALLATLLYNNRILDTVATFLSADHFYDVAHARLFEVIQQTVDAGGPATPVSLRVVAESDPVLSAAGGMAFVASVAACMVTAINAEHYARTLMDLYQKRQIIETCNRALADCYDSGVDITAANIIESIDGRLSVTTDEGVIGTAKTRSFKDALLATTAEWETYAREGDCGVSTGLLDLDAKMGTMQPSDLIVLGGRPSMGKTALALTIAKNSSDDEFFDGGKRATAFFSLEMSTEQLTSRIITGETGVAAPRRRKEPMTGDDWNAVVKMADAHKNLPLHIDDTGAATLSYIRAVCRRLQRKGGLKLVVIDYLQLMGIERGLKFSNDVEKLSYLTAGLKALAKLLNVPILVLSQLNRGVEQREDKRPQLADLRQSGSIEQDADTVIFCYRDYYYLERKVIARREGETAEHFAERMDAHDSALAAAENTAEVIIAKARHGEPGMVTSHFDGPRTKFSDLARGETRR